MLWLFHIVLNGQIVIEPYVPRPFSIIRLMFSVEHIVVGIAGLQLSAVILYDRADVHFFPPPGIKDCSP